MREGINDSRAVNSLSDSAEIFYRRLISLVDDYGRYEADPELLRARLFARCLDRWPLTRVSEVLSDVSEALTDDGHPLVTVWHHQDSNKKYLQINNFNQRVRAEKSKFPEPPSGIDRHMTVTSQTDDGHLRASRARTSSTTTEGVSSVLVVSSSEERTTTEVSPAVSAPEVEILSPLEAKIKFTAKAIHARHPAIRRSPLSHVEKKLRTIANKFPSAERVELLSNIDLHHKGMCESEQWTKDGGEFAKGLDNWLSPSKDYWAQPPPEKTRVLSKSEESLARAAQIFESGILNIGGRKQ